MRPSVRFAIGSVLIFVALSFGRLSLVSAAEQCPNPRQGYPSISFGMIGLGQNFCKMQLDRARWLGFTTVSMSPAFYFNEKDGAITPAFPMNDLTACWNVAKDLGFDIVYKPMIEAGPGPSRSGPFGFFIRLLKGRTLEESLMQTPNQSNAPWRAWFDFRPSADYQQQVIEPFISWLQTSQVRGTNLKGAIVVATELHRSLVDYGADWKVIIEKTQAELAQANLRSQVQVGLDPTIFGQDSWLPPEIRRILTPKECDNYQKMLWSADFFSPSVYGDYLSGGFPTQAAASVNHLYEKAESNWETIVAARGCTVDSRLASRFKDGDYAGRDQGRTQKITWPGEIGYAGNLKESWSGFKTPPPYSQGTAAMELYRTTTLVKEQQEFITNAPVWVKGILDQARGSRLDTVSFWITGRFDVFGFSSLPPLGELSSYEGQYTSVDPVKGADSIPANAQIRDLLQNYTRTRCAGWSPKFK